MALTREGALTALRDTLEIREAEMAHLDTLWAYRRGKQPHPMESMLRHVPQEVQDFLRFSRVNMIKLVLDVLAQSLYVEGYANDNPDGGGLVSSATTPSDSFNASASASNSSSVSPIRRRAWSSVRPCRRATRRRAFSVT